MRTTRSSVALFGVSLGLVAFGGMTASQAFGAAVVDENYAPFVNCPVKDKAVQLCIVATTTSGEFVMGSKTIKIESPVILQGAVSNNGGNQELVAPTSGPILQAAPMKVPGGLTGIEGVGEEVTATTELVGPVFLNIGNQATGNGTAVILPIRAKLNNSVLGKECFVGSAAEPILLQLTTGTTAPPPPNTPITGSVGTVRFYDGAIDELAGVSLVNNSFAAPGATGCGESLSAVLDPVVNASAGLPASSGHNTAILNGSVLLTSTKAVRKSHVIKKPKKH